MSIPTPTELGRAWTGAAEQLADHALARVFVRTDRFGGYYRDQSGETQKSARPNKGCKVELSHKLLVQHFCATDPEDVIGAYPLTAGADCRGRWVGIDIDAHTEADDKRRNRRYAEHLVAKLKALGFRALALTWGTGGFHVWVFLSHDIPGADLYAFARWVVADAQADPWNFPQPVETFPKQEAVPEGKFGNWLRLFGRHHTKDRFAAVFDGTAWVQGQPAVDYILGCTGDSPELIPSEARPQPKPERNGHHPAPLMRIPRGDVFDAFNRSVGLAAVAGWHEDRGHTVVRRDPDRVEFCRAGKDGGGLSFSVKNIDGIPITYNFSPNAGLPDHKGLTPSQVRCLYETGACDTAGMARFAERLRAELGWPRTPRPVLGRRPESGEPTDELFVPRGWDDPVRLADGFLLLHTVAFVKKTGFVFAGGRYEPTGDESIEDRVWKHVEAEAVAEYERLLRLWQEKQKGEGDEGEGEAGGEEVGGSAVTPAGDDRAGEQRDAGDAVAGPLAG